MLKWIKNGIKFISTVNQVRQIIQEQNIEQIITLFKDMQIDITDCNKYYLYTIMNNMFYNQPTDKANDVINTKIIMYGRFLTLFYSYAPDQNNISGLFDHFNQNIKDIQKIHTWDENRTGYELGRPMYIVFDHNQETIVCIRGTCTIGDVITDLNHSTTCVEYNGQQYYFHNGFYKIALNLYNQLKFNNLINKHLVITGYSMGASAASILSFLLLQDDLQIKTYCFAPAPCMSLNACILLQNTCKTFIYENDLIPVTSHHQIQVLLKRIQNFKNDENYRESSTTLSENHTQITALYLPGFIYRFIQNQLFKIQQHDYAEFRFSIYDATYHTHFIQFIDNLEKLK